MNLTNRAQRQRSVGGGIEGGGLLPAVACHVQFAIHQFVVVSSIGTLGGSSSRAGFAPVSWIHLSIVVSACSSPETNLS